MQNENGDPDFSNQNKKEFEEDSNKNLSADWQIPNQNRLITNNMFFIIPSWSDLIGYDILGSYVHKEVSQILNDIIVFFGCIECSIQTEKGTIHMIFGLGNYYTKFGLKHGTELQQGKYIIDNKQLTCLVLSDFVYDYMATSSNITLQEDKDIIIAENVIKIPIDLSFKSEGQQTMIKGIIMRNVFIPNKDIILETMNNIKAYDTYDVENQGHFILTTHWDYYNKILVSNKLSKNINEKYTNSTAGIREIGYGADEFLQKLLSPIELKQIKEKIQNLKQIFSQITYDPMYPYSILQSASMHLKSDTLPLSMQEPIPTSGPIQKTSILFSAENRVHSLVGWPKEFERKEKPIVEKIESPIPIMYQSNLKNTQETSNNINTTQYQHQEPARDEKQFQLRMEKTEKVEVKSLPLPPRDNLENILDYVKNVIEQNFDMPSSGRAFGMARDNLAILYPVEHQKIKWELSHLQNIYEKKERFIGFSPKDKKEILEKIDGWIKNIEEERKLEQERIARELIERELKEKEKREWLEKNRLEKERMEHERIEKERRRQEQIEKQLKQREIAEKERKQKEALEKEKQELKAVKDQIKKENKRKKQEKKLQKKIKKLEKKKQKEQERLEKLKK
ncbi:MAG: hypothetical protein JXA99_10995 [Candidatus Lokiarchaeota archaeon]|nr:hypothetical protein [Candidatus Lokiarchaeota archaeon]